MQRSGSGGADVGAGVAQAVLDGSLRLALLLGRQGHARQHAALQQPGATQGHTSKSEVRQVVYSAS